MRTEPLNLLFVCTANISRSPYAERRARMLLGGAPITVASAGVPGYPDRSMDREMAAQLELRGGDPTGHVSRALDGDLLNWADLVVTFEYAHDLKILERWPEAAQRIFGLNQFAKTVTQFDAAHLSGPELISQARAVAERNSMGWDVDDPYGRGKRAATTATAHIDHAVESIIRGLLGLRPAADGPRRADSSRHSRPRG